MSIDFYEKERIQELKYRMIKEQGGMCAVCEESFVESGRHPEMAHRIPKHKYLIKKHGAATIHHRFNLRITCPGTCNDAVLLNPESLEAKELIERIQDDLLNDGILY